MAAISVDAFAKVNFTLEVFGRRADGYHALRSLVVPISLADRVTVASAAETSSDTGFADDLCLKAVRALDPEGRRGGVAISVEKRIPVGGGLGGGSADAAATLVALNGLWNLQLPPAALAEIGATVGSDVPALVLSRFAGPVIMEGRGEIVSAAARPDELPPLDLVLANPGVHSSTAEVYRGCSAREASSVAAHEAVLVAWRRGDLAEVAAALVNDLEAPAVKLHPEIAAAMRAMSDAGAVGVRMSGSGATVFALCDSPGAAAGLARMMRDRGCRAWSARTR